MGRKTQERRIGDLDVAVTQFKPRRAYHVIATMLKTLGPVLGSVVPALAAGGVGALLRMNGAELGAAFAALDVDASDALLVELLRGTSVVGDVNGKRAAFDLSRGGDTIDDAFDDAGLGALFEAVKFVIEVNFAGFTKSAAALAGPAAAPAAGTPST